MNTQANAMSRLRSGTQKIHCELESELAIETQLESRESYKFLIARFHGLYRYFEPVLAKATDWGALGIDFNARRKLPFLTEDLHRLNHSPEPNRTPRIVPKLGTPAQALGCLYVLEGSTLGGQIISRLLKNSLAIDATNGGAFFTGYGHEETGPMWRAFGAAANAYDPHGSEAMVDAASETFAMLRDWMCKDETG